MQTQHGFTLIEMIISIAICGILAAMVVPVIMGGTSTMNNTISYGINGMTEMRCIDGYKFIVGQNGQARQVLDEFGKGAKCETQHIGSK